MVKEYEALPGFVVASGLIFGQFIKMLLRCAVYQPFPIHYVHCIQWLVSWYLSVISNSDCKFSCVKKKVILLLSHIHFFFFLLGKPMRQQSNQAHIWFTFKNYSKVWILVHDNLGVNTGNCVDAATLNSLPSPSSSFLSLFFLLMYLHLKFHI